MQQPFVSEAIRRCTMLNPVVEQMIALLEQMRMKVARALLGVLMLVLLALPAPVYAHAQLVRSDPPAGAVLAQAPRAIVLEYTEALDPASTRVVLLDADGQVVAPGPGEIAADAPELLRLSLGSLPDGAYNAVWQARSAIDGHVTNGTLSFAVGAGARPASLLPAPGTPGPARETPPLEHVLLRWLNFAFAALVAGVPIFALLAWLPTLRTNADPATARLLRGLLLIAVPGLVLASLAVAAVHALPDLAGALSGRSGVLLVIRLGALAGLLALTPRLVRAARAPWAIAALLGATVLLTFALQSHGAATGSPIAIAADWLHLAAMAAWLGGLVPLLTLLARRRGEIRPVVERFSNLALVSVLLLIATGIYSARLHVRTFEALAETTYGVTLLLKLLIFCLLLGLGAINMLLIVPRLPQASARPLRWLRHTVSTEVTLGMLVLVAAALMTAAAPAFEALEAQRRIGFIATARAADVRLRLLIAPAHAGENEFAVEVDDPRPGAHEVEPEVLLRLSMRDHTMGTIEVPAEQAAGRYQARGSYLAMNGTWNVQVIVRRPGFDDVTATFEVLIGEQ